MSPRSKKANQQILEERREQILWAALKVFAKRGLAATKISDIASAAGLSHGLIYHYFKTKDDIFIELVKRAYESSLGVFKYASQLDISPLEKFRTITEMTISGAYQGEGVYFWNIVLQAHISEAIPETLVKMSNNTTSLINEIFVPIIIEGQKLGQFVQGDPSELATAYYSMLNGIAVVQMMAKDDKNNSRSLPNTDIVIRLLTNPESKDQLPMPKIIKNQFEPVQLIHKSLIYRSRKGTDAEFINFKSTAIEALKNGNKVYRIESEDDAGDKKIALVKANSLQPIYTEISNSEDNTITKIEYNNDFVTFNSPAHNLNNKIKLSGEYYDYYTLPFILRGFPFESDEKIKFTLILDGSEGRPVGPWGMEAQRISLEKVQVPAGEFNCYKLEMGIAHGVVHIAANKFYYWYTTDEPRFLIKYEDMQRGYLIELVDLEYLL